MRLTSAYVILAACASPPPSHTIAPAYSSNVAVETHWPDASVNAPIDRASVVARLRALHAVVEVWRVGHADECPTLGRLVDDHELAAATRADDDWGHPYKVVCDEDETHIVSYGPDGREGTPDDIVYPDPKR